MHATQTISHRILGLVESGMDVMEAVKHVCGEDAVNEMVSSLYDALRSK